MSITNITIAPSDSRLSANITIADPAGNDRKVVLFGLQRRATLNLANPTLDGVAPTAIIESVDYLNTRLIACYWDDADLPAASGVYTAAVTGPDTAARIGVFSCSGAKQGVVAGKTSLVGTGNSVSYTLASVPASVSLIAMAMASTSTVTKDANQVTLVDPDLSKRHASDYNIVDSSLSYSMSYSTNYNSTAFVVEPANFTGITSLDDLVDGDLASAGTYVGFTGSDISNVTIDSAGSAVLATNVVDDGIGGVTFTPSSIKDIVSNAGTVVPNFGAIDVDFSNGAEAASIAGSLSPAPGWAVTTLESLDLLNPDYLYQLALGATPSITLSDGWEVYYNAAFNTAISPAGALTSDIADNTFINMVFINRVAGDLAYPYQYVNAVAVIDNAALIPISARRTIGIIGFGILRDED